MKTILLYTGIFVVGFIVLFAGMYLVYPYLQPEKAAKAQEAVQSEQLPPIYDYTTFSPLKIDTLNTIIARLKKEIRAHKSAPDKYKVLSDSLVKVSKQQKQLIGRLRDSLDVQEKAIAAQLKKNKPKSKGIQFSEVTKSLLSMDEKSLSPILKKLNDNMLVGLYRDGSNMQREKLLRSLNPDRAAQLLKKVAQ